MISLALTTLEVTMLLRLFERLPSPIVGIISLVALVAVTVGLTFSSRSDRGRPTRSEAQASPTPSASRLTAPAGVSYETATFALG